MTHSSGRDSEILRPRAYEFKSTEGKGSFENSLESLLGLETESISAVVGGAQKIKSLAPLHEHYSKKKVVQGQASDWADMDSLNDLICI